MHSQLDEQPLQPPVILVFLHRRLDLAKPGDLHLDPVALRAKGRRQPTLRLAAHEMHLMR